MLFDVQAALADIISDSTVTASQYTMPMPEAVSASGISHPPVCAICGKADWTVALTDIDGRRLHVGCWKGMRT